jgi:hypothetical protein
MHDADVVANIRCERLVDDVPLVILNFQQDRGGGQGR